LGEPYKGHRVKGALLVALATVINASKDVNWSKETVLTEEDLSQIKKGVLAYNWYDRGLWERMSIAVWKLVGKGIAESAYIFGKGMLADTMLKVYQGPLIQKDIREMLRTFAHFYGTVWFNFGSEEFEVTDEGNVLKTIHHDGIPIRECFIPMVKGVVTRMVETNGGINVRVECDEERLADSQKLTTLTLRVYWN
jgi:hypothetical protein